jgi:hypothetical protein
MLRIRINNEPYSIPLSVDDISIEKHLALSKAESDMPEKLKAILDETDSDKRVWMSKRVKKTEYAKEFLPYYATAISIMSGVPIHLLLGDKEHEGAPVAMLEAWYWKIMSAYGKFEIDETVSSFVIEGEEYFLPENGMANSTFGEFAEAAQYEDFAADVAAGNMAAIPKVMAVLLKKKGEKYNPDLLDEKVEERSKLFLSAPLSVAYNTAFFLLRLNEKSRISSLIYTAARTIVASKQELTN